MAGMVSSQTRGNSFQAMVKKLNLVPVNEVVNPTEQNNPGITFILLFYSFTKLGSEWLQNYANPILDKNDNFKNLKNTQINQNSIYKKIAIILLNKLFLGYVFNGAYTPLSCKVVQEVIKAKSHNSPGRKYLYGMIIVLGLKQCNVLKVPNVSRCLFFFMNLP